MKIEELIQGIENLFNAINFSSEKQRLLQRFINLILISILKDDLEKAKIELKNKDQNEYFADVMYLRATFNSPNEDYLENIKWFLDSSLFNIMLRKPELFRINLARIYGQLLNNVEFDNEQEVFQTKSMLIEKANSFIDKDLGAFCISELFGVLAKKIHEFRSLQPNHNRFHRLRKLPNVPSPLALESTNNSKAILNFR